MPVLKRRLRYQDSKDEKRKRSTRRFKDSTLRKKSASLKPSRKKMLESPDKKSVFRAVQQHQKQHRNATQKTESKGSAQSAKKYNIMKRSSGSDEKVLGELRSIFSEDSKTGQKKTVKKREDSSVALKSGDGGSDSSKAESDEDKFKKWLLDEYYRTMALSFASMRKKRMAVHQDTLDLRKMKRDEQQADDQFQAVEEKLRGIEDAMIGEALELVRDGAGDESDLRAINAGVASRLDAAYDLESVRQSLGHLEATLDTMRRREDGDDAGQPEDVDDGPQGSWAQLVDKEAHSLIPPKKRQEEEVLTEPGQFIAPQHDSADTTQFLHSSHDWLPQITTTSTSSAAGLHKQQRDKQDLRGPGIHAAAKMLKYSLFVTQMLPWLVCPIWNAGQFIAPQHDSADTTQFLHSSHDWLPQITTTSTSSAAGLHKQQRDKQDLRGPGIHAAAKMLKYSLFVTQVASSCPSNVGH
ncbi:uncharacterized protein ISCGN_018223 [Ixodes scapularis]